jgi:hypothetical protein
MIPATCVDSSAWGIPEGLMLADENFNRPISIDIISLSPDFQRYQDCKQQQPIV